MRRILAKAFLIDEQNQTCMLNYAERDIKPMAWNKVTIRFDKKYIVQQICLGLWKFKPLAGNYKWLFISEYLKHMQVIILKQQGLSADKEVVLQKLCEYFDKALILCNKHKLWERRFIMYNKELDKFVSETSAHQFYFTDRKEDAKKVNGYYAFYYHLYTCGNIRPYADCQYYYLTEAFSK